MIIMQEQPQKFKEQFFSQIYDEHINKIYRFVFFKVESDLIAQDITSETFTRLWKQIYLNKEINNPSAFLYKAAKNLVIDYYRAKEKKPDNLGEAAILIKDEKQNLAEQAMIDSDMIQVQKALAQLSDEHRQAVSAYYIEQLPISDVAKGLGKSAGATRVIISRGMKQLRQILEA
jgi:RNA polymerase sigma-70 factor (ECF subfamily)